ncbi:MULTISPECIES: hypothetical protein [Cyanophyceae]|uniref:Uncharacterized protein n=1 Tax=Leptolyngbya subtilissima DQ-A4 TaxID=2933933 RepID=A0ABV0K7T9_9CYAN|nr:hypothetical protein [Nodosilinea sp. FACHB-141]MBD2114663.1 hypothetical protein [Nodosilinea sp. FACHB-141]
MMQHETPPAWQTALFHILLSVTSGATSVMFGGTIAALRNGASHVTEACGIGIAGCGSSQHWATWSVAVAVLFYAGIMNSLILGSIHGPAMTSTRGSDLSLVLTRWMRQNLDAAQASPRVKQGLVLSLLLGVLGVMASAAIGGAVGGYVYGNFITGLGAAHGVPAIGWLFGITFGLGAGSFGAMLFGSIAGIVSGVMLRRQPRSPRRS